MRDRVRGQRRRWETQQRVLPQYDETQDVGIVELIAKEVPIAASSQASFSTGSTRDLRAWTLTRPEAVCFGTARWVQRKVRRQVQRKVRRGATQSSTLQGAFAAARASRSTAATS